MTVDTLSLAQQQCLLRLAHASISFCLTQGQRPSRQDLLAILPEPLDPLFEAERSAFVTLKLQGKLRGCIGSVLPSQPLVDEIIVQSVNAALQDPRFAPLSETERADCRVEISVLSQPAPVEHYKNIDLKRHGIILKKEGKSALFLPKVASEQGWDLYTTLQHLCRKAGLKKDDWQHDMLFFVFEAFEFKET